MSMNQVGKATRRGLLGTAAAVAGAATFASPAGAATQAPETIAPNSAATAQGIARYAQASSAASPAAPTQLETDDIQSLILMRVPALSGQYQFLSFRDPLAGGAWLAGIRSKIGSAKSAAASMDRERVWIYVAFTWPGLRALGVDEASLASFPEEFRQGMAARAQVLGDTGPNHPDHWGGDLASPDLHAIVITFARDRADRERAVREQRSLLAQTPGVELLSWVDVDAVPPFDAARDHFGYRDRLTTPEIEGTGVVPTPGSGPPVKPGEFILGYPDEWGPPAGRLPEPSALSRNGTYVAYR